MSEPAPSRLTFAEWFDRSYRRSDETRPAAMRRLYVEVGVHTATTKRALEGKPVHAHVATRLVEASNGELCKLALIEPHR